MWEGNKLIEDNFFMIYTIVYMVGIVVPSVKKELFCSLIQIGFKNTLSPLNFSRKLYKNS